jgi:hypothetical protein
MPTPSVGYTRADKAAITAIGAADRADGYLLFPLDENKWYRYDDLSTLTADGKSVLEPDDLPSTGRWIATGGQIDTGCKIYRGSAFTVADGTLGFPSTAIPFTLESYDTDSMHDTSTNNSRITINTAGKYYIWGSVQFSNASFTGERSLRLYKNGSTTVAFNIQLASQVLATIVQVYCEMDCTVGDYFELYPGQNSGADLDLSTFGDEWEITFGARKVG